MQSNPTKQSNLTTCDITNITCGICFSPFQPEELKSVELIFHPEVIAYL